MDEELISFSEILYHSSKNNIEVFNEHYEIEKEFFQNVNYLIDEDFKSELINVILEMEKSIQIDIDSSTKDSSYNETYSEIMKILNNPIKKKLICKICGQNNSCKCIKKPKPLFNSTKIVSSSNYKKCIYIARRVKVNANL
jgi:hypothetical protein